MAVIRVSTVNDKIPPVIKIQNKIFSTKSR